LMRQLSDGDQCPGKEQCRRDDSGDGFARP